MSKKNTDARRGDAVLSQEEFEKAIDEYKARKAEREQTEAEDANEVVETAEVKEPETIEEKVAAVKERRDRRDEAGDPKDTEEAMSVIAHQDEDLDILFDIIDTLLAKQDFDAAEPVKEEEEVVDKEVVDEEKEDGFDKVEKLKKDADEEEEEVIEEEPIDQELPMDDEIVEEEEEVKEDADDDMVEEEDVEEEDWEEDGCGEKRMDSAASRAIRNHMIMGKLGREVGLKNLEFKDLKDAKIAIVKAVRPDMRLDGKSDAYINGAFDNARKSIKARKVKDTSYQKRQMFNKDSADKVESDNYSATDARAKMIERQLKTK